MKEMYAYALQKSPPSRMKDWDTENRIENSKGYGVGVLSRDQHHPCRKTGFNELGYPYNN
jgi:hypothetical protein